MKSERARPRDKPVNTVVTLEAGEVKVKSAVKTQSISDW